MVRFNFRIIEIDGIEIIDTSKHIYLNCDSTLVLEYMEIERTLNEKR